MNKKGFTLAEVMALMVIVAILSMVTIPAFKKVKAAAMEKQAERLEQQVAFQETNGVIEVKATTDGKDNLSEIEYKIRSLETDIYMLKERNRMLEQRIRELER